MRLLFASLVLLYSAVSPAASHYYPSWMTADDVHGTWTCETQKKTAVITIGIDTGSGMMEIHSDSGSKKNFTVAGHFTSRTRTLKGYGEFLFLDIGTYNLMFTSDGKVQFNQHLLCVKK